jgi:hypothetical protein
MTDPIAFGSATPRYELPLLFAGQSQKEITVNECSARIDMLLQPAIKGRADNPPAAPVDGDCWLVGTGIDDWSGHDHELAAWLGGNWLFVKPRAGLRAYDAGTRQTRFYDGASWGLAPRPADPVGGQIADAEARTAIGEIYDILATLGWIPPS